MPYRLVNSPRYLLFWELLNSEQVFQNVLNKEAIIFSDTDTYDIYQLINLAFQKTENLKVFKSLPQTFFQILHMVSDTCSFSTNTENILNLSQLTILYTHIPFRVPVSSLTLYYNCINLYCTLTELLKP